MAKTIMNFFLQNKHSTEHSTFHNNNLSYATFVMIITLNLMLYTILNLMLYTIYKHYINSATETASLNNLRMNP